MLVEEMQPLLQRRGLGADLFGRGCKAINSNCPSAARMQLDITS